MVSPVEPAGQLLLVCRMRRDGTAESGLVGIIPPRLQGMAYLSREVRLLPSVLRRPAAHPQTIETTVLLNGTHMRNRQGRRPTLSGAGIERVKPVDRRTFLHLIAGTGAARAGGAIERRPDHWLSEVRERPQVTPGIWTVYATTCRDCC